MVYYARWGVALAAVLAVLAPAPVSAAVNPADRAATNAYLLARYREEQALLANAPVFDAAYSSAASRLGAECAGVLQGAPQESFPPHPEAELKESARQRGEAKREGQQLSDLREEASSVLSAAGREADRAPLTAFAAEMRSLTWHNAAITALVHGEASEMEMALVRAAPSACADMKAWVASGHRTLSPASKALVEEREGSFGQVRGTLGGYEALRRSEEGPAEKQLARELHHAEQLLLDAREPTIVAANGALDSALGLESHEQRERELFERVRNRHKGAIEIGAGKTAAGTRYAIRLVPGRRPGGPFGECKLNVEIEAGHSSSRECASLSHSDPQASVECDEGRLTIEESTLPATRFVRLRLSDGRQIVSRSAVVPTRFGRQGGYYYQAVRGPAPIPVELVELGAHGRQLRSVKLERFVGCTKHPFKYVRGGLLTLVRERAPRGPEFTLVAERFRLYGRTHFRLTLSKGLEIGSPSDEGGYRGAFEGGASASEGEGEGPRRSALDLEFSAGCHPYEYAIAYGLLRDPRDKALVEVKGKLLPLKRVAIPARFHSGGALVYAGLNSAPEGLVVKSPAGMTIESRDMRRQATEDRETCEGESEGEGPSVGQDEGSISISFGEVG